MSRAGRLALICTGLLVLVVGGSLISKTVADGRDPNTIHALGTLPERIAFAGVLGRAIVFFGSERSRTHMRGRASGRSLLPPAHSPHVRPGPAPLPPARVHARPWCGSGSEKTYTWITHCPAGHSALSGEGLDARRTEIARRPARGCGPTLTDGLVGSRGGNCDDRYHRRRPPPELSRVPDECSILPLTDSHREDREPFPASGC